MIEPAKLLVIALIAAVGLAPIASSRHELTVRHVRCAEHGELTHVRATDGLSVEPSRQLASVEGETDNATDGHDHCSSGFLVRGRMHVSVLRSLVRFTPPPTVTREIRDVAATPGRAFVLASAPKTSPPSA
jgi:hypothetical protein